MIQQENRIAPEPPSFYLAKDVYLCVTDDCPVILALERDQYIAISSTRASSLASYVHGWPKVTSSTNHSPIPNDREQLIAEMLGAGLLTTDPTRGHSPTLSAADHAETTWIEIDSGSEPAVQPRDVLYLAVACIKAAVLLGTLSLHSVVRRVTLRKLRNSASHIDLSRVHRLVQVFAYWRPVFYTPRRKCLFDSLVLLEFLSLHGERATWVFGVQTGPFAAHCWVQIGTCICNDTPEKVRHFTPILVV